MLVVQEKVISRSNGDSYSGDSDASEVIIVILISSIN